MNILDKLFGLDLIEDVTETTWWADGVFRRLESDASDGQSIDFEVTTARTQLPTGLE